MIYQDFLDRKSHVGGSYGFEPITLPSAMYPFQQAMTTWALQQGRAALFEACGLGKTIQQLAWADNVVRHTGKRVLILTPLAVAPQTVAEGQKFGLPCRHSRDGTLARDTSVIISNYEQLHRFSSQDFVGVVADESSCLKDFDGKRRQQITEFVKQVPYRLLCSATPAPNDYVELGTSGEALGALGHIDMLNRFFRNQNHTSDTKGRYRGSHARHMWEGKQWRFKGHAELPFWRWVTSWARAIEKPSDLGFDDAAFRLPPLTEQTHLIKAQKPPDGMLFEMTAIGLQEQRDERRRTIEERCTAAAALVNTTTEPAMIWCQLNPEGDQLETLIPDAEQISGQDSDQRKEEIAAAFIRGDVRVLISKAKIFGWGINFQHCAHVIYFPSHSYEAYHQAIRRCWRFGQTKTVMVDLVMTEGDQSVMENMQRKSVAAQAMFASLVAEMQHGLAVHQDTTHRTPTEVPSWLS